MYPPHRRSLDIPRGKGVLEAKVLEETHEAKLKFLVGMGAAKQKPIGGGSKDGFWNLTLLQLILTA